MTQFGQHFLVDRSVLRSMVTTVAKHGSHATLLEIGPGRGVLTRELVRMADRVIAVEIDRTLSVPTYPNLEIIYADILKLNLTTLGLRNGEYSVASNLPYDITGVVLRRFLTEEPYPSHMALLLQKEVAQRITAKPGDLSILGLSVQTFSQPRIVRTVSRAAFRPQPQVESAVVSLERIHQSIPFTPKQEKKFFWLIKVGFAQKRKLLSSNLKNAHLPAEVIQQTYQELGLPKTARAQELSLKQWCDLVDKLDKFIV